MWGEEGIDVKYEDDEIEVKSAEGGKHIVIPDELPQRILFAWELFRKLLLDTGWNMSNVDYFEGTFLSDMSRLENQWIESYKKSGFGREVCDKLYNCISQVRELTDGVKMSIMETGRPFRATEMDGWHKSSLSRVKRIDSLLEELRTQYFAGEDGKGKRNADGLRVARSINMLRAAEVIAQKESGIIYKIGNKHMEDIIDGRAVETEISSRIALRERKAYLKEYHDIVNEKSGYKGLG